MSEITKFATNAPETLAPMQICMHKVISQCVDEEDVRRPTSAVILDELRPYLRHEAANTCMLADALAKILAFDTDGNASRRKKLRIELNELSVLFQRLLETVTIPSGYCGDLSMVDAAVQFVNEQLEILGAPAVVGSSLCPPWKTTIIQQLADLLNEKGAQGVLKPYNIGARTFEAFAGEKKLQRTQILLDIVATNILPRDPALRPAIINMIAKNAEFDELLLL